DAGGDFARRGGGVAVFFVVGTVAVSVFEVDAEVFHRLAAELLDHAPVDRLRLRAIDADGGGEGRAVRRVLLQCAQCELPELLRRVGLEQLRAAVHGVHRLAGGRIAGKAFDEARERRVERRGGAADVVVAERGFHVAVEVYPARNARSAVTPAGRRPSRGRARLYL